MKVTMTEARRDGLAACISPTASAAFKLNRECQEEGWLASKYHRLQGGDRHFDLAPARASGQGAGVSRRGDSGQALRAAIFYSAAGGLRSPGHELTGELLAMEAPYAENAGHCPQSRILWTLPSVHAGESGTLPALR